MTPEALAALHEAAFAGKGPWSAASFAELLMSPHVQLLTRPNGFALIRTIAGESELLTLAVHPDVHRRGIARDLMRDWLGRAAAQADSAFLEVAADNLAARALYDAFDFRETGRRPGYYRRESGKNADAVLMSRPLTHG